MVRIRTAALAAILAVLGITGCGGSAATAPPATAPVPVQTATASTQGSGGASVDVGKEQAAAERSLRTWGKAASRACRKAQRRMKPWEGRVRAMTSHKPTRARAVALGKVVARGARAAEYEYDLLRDVQLPAQAEAVHTIYTFLEMEEEALRLVQRLGTEFTELNDLESLVFTVKRFDGLEDDYRRAAKAAHAGACA
ncbi:MAG TPA: hypothetical protein VF715_18010 [Thermoleophilaceae bacterium]